MPQPKSKRARRTALTRDEVVGAAVRLADEAGIEAITMRRLGQTLGVEAMTLYYHVGSKDAMLDALVDRVTAEWDVPRTDGDWRVAIRTTALSAYASLERHPWAAALALSLKRPSAARLRYMDAILGVLRAAGFSDELVDRGYHAIEGHIMGFTLWEVGMNLRTREDLHALASQFLRELPTDEFPHVAEHVEHHLRQRRPDEVGAFEFGLRLILDGLERLRDTTIAPE